MGVAISFGFLALLGIVPLIFKTMSEEKFSQSLLPNGAVCENIFDERRARIISHYIDKNGDSIYKYVVDGSGNLEEMPVNLFTNQFKRLSNGRKA